MKKSTISLTLYNQALKKYVEKINSGENERFSAYLYIIFTLITVSFFGLFAINPTLSTLSNLEKQKQDSIDTEKQLSDKIKNLNTLDRLYNQLTPDLNYIYSAIPTSPKIPYLSRQLETLTSNHNLSLEQIDFQPIELYPGTKTTIPLYSFTFTLNAQGKEADINRFISDIISFDRLVNVESITTGKSDNNSGTFSTTVTGRVYYYN